MQLDKNTPYYVFTIAVFLVCKAWFMQAETIDLRILLLPTTTMIEWMTSTQSVFMGQMGYFFESLNIYIERSCSGFNFWMLCFVMFAVTTVRYVPRHWMKVLAIPTALVLAFFATLFVNTSRIMVSMFLQQALQYHSPGLHQVQGIFIYFSFLLGAYLLLKYLLNKIYPPHAQLA